GAGNNDVLLAINRNTGGYIPDFFGAGVDYVEITGTNIKEDIDDIAFNPYTNQLLAINMQGTGDSTRYISIDPATGTSTVISITGVGDFESLGYYNTGELYGTTGVEPKAGYPANSFYKINRNTGVGTMLDNLTGAVDVEACDCLTGPTSNLLSGTVFYDNDSSGTYDENIDSAYGGIKVYLYRDVDGNGVLDSIDYIIDSTYSESTTGYYVFKTDSLGDFLTQPVIDGTPLAGNNTTTGDSLTADIVFTLHGDFDGQNDFGFHISSGQPYLPVDWLHVDAAWIDTKNSVVTWSTASEINSSHYVVERKVGTGSFYTIGEVDAAGQSSELSNYSFLDINANELESQYLHYRVKQVDYNGTSSYSDIVSLEKKEQVHIAVYPNPVGATLNINLDAKGEYHILITDMVGTEVTSLSGYTQTKFSPIRIEGLNQLRRGLYLVRISYNGEETIVKILK
ncbi:MAG: T9SS type A sorting domain-containing protein, partial [Bacteroidia bacterium]|nr:T9SS type A sorting domain-containing protein [Bacteroidia bacterium]